MPWYFISFDVKKAKKRLSQNTTYNSVFHILIRFTLTETSITTI